MKTKFITLLALSWTCLATAQITADGLITQGRSDLAAQDVWDANTNFTYALTLSPTNATANLLAAATRLLVLPQTSAGSNFLNQLYVTNGSRNIYNWTATQPVDAKGNTVWPASYNSSTPIAFFRTTVMAALAASATNLANIKDPNFTLTLLASETTHAEDVTLDYGDVQLLRALVAAGQFMGYTINAQNASVVIPTLQTMAQNNTLTLQSVMATYPSLLTLSTPADLATSKGALTNAIALYFAASDFIRNVRAPGAVRLFNLDTNNTTEEAQFRTELTNALLSLNGPVQIDPPQAVSINASNYFSGARTLRSLLPQFNGWSYVNDTLPDYTFGGILLNEPAYKTETALRKGFFSYAGIYSGYVYDNTFGDPNAGSFAVFVSTNQQVTIAGYDIDSFQNFNGQAGGVSAQFTVDKGGNWQFNSNNVAGVSGYGSVGKDGSFSGELDFTNGDSVWLDGYAQPAVGPFQNAAGNYSGTWSGTFNGKSQSGTVKAVLSADGQVTFCSFNQGADNDGGQGQFGLNNKFISTLTTSGTTVSGTLNPSTFQITGSSSNQWGSATWTMTRSANVPFDVPPVITSNLPPAKFASLGTNVTFSLVATGSPPMSFQWYDNNNVLIPSATTNVLVVSNLQYSAAGTYSVSINNCAGGTNASITLTVTAETIPPTNQITAPTPGLQVSNAAYMVTGRAGDNVAVSNVWVQLNATGWNPANTVNQWTNWTAQTTLIPGSNTVQAYAMDTSGNVSMTNKVIFDYVVSAPLTVQLFGRGTVLPNYSNAVLQVGSAYSMTAAVVAGSGFAFANWTGGTSLPLAVLTNGATVQFIMASNLTLQANFADTNKPVLSITNLTAGQRWSNMVFTVLGTATDNWQVASVQYQFNHGVWTNASGTKNWAAPLTLMPGTNLFAAYATDTSGNNSPTNSLNFQFVVTNLLGVRANGLGTISPNYSNSWLEVGRNYSMTATPATGFTVTNWTISTNWLGGIITNNATVQFMMASNLTLQINFADISRPILTITAPTAGQKMTNALAAFVGTASDNWNIAGVWCQLNSNAWNLVTTTNSYTNWTKTVTLLVGTNTLKAYALDLGGNYSITNSISVVSSNTFKLQLTITNALSMDASGLVFSLQLSTGLNGHIQVSTNLTSWATLTNFVGTNSTLNFRDPAVTNSSRKFYRAVIP
jgi:hypothetical protein